MKFISSEVGQVLNVIETIEVLADAMADLADLSGSIGPDAIKDFSN